jgi:hypothetical protein
MKRLLLYPLASLALVSSAHAETGLARHKQLYAVPAPARVVVDGQLDEWDLSGQIDMFVVSESKDTQSARFALMYDKEALYLSGVVRDTSPMMNRQDPRVKGERGWDADSCQFRLTVDPSQTYPIKESAFDYRGKDAKVDTRDDIRHLTLWHFTDRAEACLQMQMGMGYRLPKPEWAPHGVVPAAEFEGKYVKSADGRGYTFEYRIPWQTVGAKSPLRGGQMVASTVQFNWGTADGLKTGGGAAWAYDLMSGPGFVYQNTAVWGKLLLAERGNVARDLVEAGVPVEKPAPLSFDYELPEDGQITLQLFDNENLVRRILVAQEDRKKGRNTERWDGMDDQGKPLPPGEYQVRGIIHGPITGEFLFSVHNSGNPPYPTDDNKGGWGGDHGSPTACSALPDGMLLAWDGCEFGWGIIKVDAEGRKQWGSKTQALLLANDGRRFFVYDPHGFQAAEGIQVFDVSDGRPLNFGNGKPLLQAPEGGDKTSNHATGLAVGAGKLFVSYAKRGLICVFDSTSGDLRDTWKVPTPGALALRPDGALLAVSEDSLVAIREGKATPLGSAADLNAPSGIALGADGTIFVSNQGGRQDIAVLDAAGKLVRRIGKPGGRPAVGVYDAAGLYQPNGLALDTQGRLWVAEHADSPKRISVWDSRSGAFQREFFGGSSYFAHAHVNPAVPDEIVCHNVLWRVDWEKKTTTPLGTIWRKTAPDMMEEAEPDAYHGQFRSITADNGRQYATGGGRLKTIVFRRDGNVFKPFLATFNVSRGWSLWRGLGIPDLDDPAQTPDGSYLWQDANDDQRVQMSEVHRFKDKNLRLNPRSLAPDLTLWAGGHLLKPVKVLDNGQPVYDPEKLEKNFLAGTPHANGYLWLDPDGGVYTHTSGQRPSLAKWSADGKMEWGYPSIVRWHDALSMPVVKAGRLHGMTGPLGVAGNFTGNMSYFGVCHLFQRDGICVAGIMRDGRTSGMGADVGQPEGQGGSLFKIVTKPGTAPRTFLVGSGQDARIAEVHGLDSVKPLPSTPFTLTPKAAQNAATALAEYNARFQINSTLTIAPDRKALETVRPVTRDFDGSRGFSVRAARDGQNLLLRFEVNAPAELLNASTEPKLLFKGGNCLDIQIATDPAAPADRKTPAPGDLRLLVTRQQVPGAKAPKPFVVLYRPKVKGFTGEPTVLNSPTGKESFDAIEVVESVGLEYRKTGSGFSALVSIPLELLGLNPSSGQTVRMDVGYLYGNATGTLVAARSYWSNHGFSANVVNDVPNESRLEPAQWGKATVE